MNIKKHTYRRTYIHLLIVEVLSLNLDFFINEINDLR